MNKDSAIFIFNRDCASIRFSIVAEEWPIDKFIKEIGITPTESYKKGDAYSRGVRKLSRFETVWSLHTGDVFLRYEEDEDKKIFDSIIVPLQPKINVINEYRKKYNLTCIFFVHYNFYDAQTPGMRIDPSVIAFANSIGAIIDVYIDNETLLDNQKKY
ncbi:DUF4279 domain-containing protein [Lysinibacillus sp. 54212]|uniref:DUF4279 domain-containing protein n=1 Tax=Lysinibacillus sp. 54212 TaxID=3119829 RepID=UPI002FC5B623